MPLCTLSRRKGSKGVAATKPEAIDNAYTNERLSNEERMNDRVVQECKGLDNGGRIEAEPLR